MFTTEPFTARRLCGEGPIQKIKGSGEKVMLRDDEFQSGYSEKLVHRRDAERAETAQRRKKLCVPSAVSAPLR